MTSHIYRPDEKHPQPYPKDLNPDAMKGVNWGLAGPHPEKDTSRTAYDIKEVHSAFHDLPDEQLQRIPILPEGARLESKATYINLRELEAQPFTAEGNEEVGPDDWIVPKSEVDYQLWNKLIGIRDPARTGEA